MKKKNYNQGTAIRGALRRAFARSPAVDEVMKASRKEEPRYNKDGSRHKKNWVKRQCQVCNKWHPTSKITVDHVDPVVSVEDGFQDWNEFILRLWCDKSNLQRICDDCHQIKTNKERFERNFVKDQELIWGLEIDARSDLFPQPNSHEYMKKKLAKFTPKKLSEYPQNFQDRVIRLKDLAKSIRPSTRPKSKENK